MKRLLLPLYLLLLSTSQGLSQEGAAAAPTIDSGNTAWIIVATALVLFMTIPGLSMFYAGLVRKKNVLSVFMHCFVITCVMSIVWLVFGYSAAFAEGGKFIGGMGKAMLSGIGTGDVYDSGHSIPELIFFAFQMTFFIITPALMVGAFVERIRFSAMLVFVTVWAILVYLPVCHMVWGGGSMLGLEGIMDHAGGIVVHITAGVGALVAVIVLGPRTGYPSHPMAPHNLPVCVAGTGMLWVGWFGFNAGSGLGADGNAAMTLIVTHISASTGALIWMVMEWFTVKKPSMLGIATGSIAGLAAITPASGAVGPIGALCIGGTSGFLCWLASTKIKQKFGYDDSLDVFGVHGVGGAVGTILVAVFAAASFGGNADADYSIGSQLTTQLLAALYTAVYTAIVSFIILKLIDATIGLRVNEREESEGLDIADHGETGYND
ncbi:ammonium transporter [bacterium]|nr:ammonium transporter [Verrucomicrobiales bacterium]MDB4468122.1 ammonium transporter [Verrucomicrobiales bacterium]MDB4507891.1 ammonium transporter [bacterium]MDC0503953.1 ammonium transporter [Verrucomicrobiales bacterium]MDF1789615.1 ammonium transporter [Verrucomicrobiales bacterium]